MSAASDILTNTTFVENKEHIQREYKHVMLENIIDLSLLCNIENNYKYYMINEENGEVIVPLGGVTMVEYLDNNKVVIKSRGSNNRNWRQFICYVKIYFECGRSKFYEVTIDNNYEIINRWLGEVFIQRNMLKRLKFQNTNK